MKRLTVGLMSQGFYPGEWARHVMNDVFESSNTYDTLCLALNMAYQKGRNDAAAAHTNHGGAQGMSVAECGRQEGRDGATPFKPTSRKEIASIYGLIRQYWNGADSAERVHLSTDDLVTQIKASSCERWSVCPATTQQSPGVPAEETPDAMGEIVPKSTLDDIARLYGVTPGDIARVYDAQGNRLTLGIRPPVEVKTLTFNVPIAAVEQAVETTDNVDVPGFPDVYYNTFMENFYDRKSKKTMGAEFRAANIHLMKGQDPCVG